MAERPWTTVLLLGLSAPLLEDCGSISRTTTSEPRLPIFAPAIEDGIQIRADDTKHLQALTTQLASRLSTADVNASILAISGGGAEGAYGAGVLVGWTTSGRRPQFDVVTGISTGALAAPFAFAGPGWDDTLRRAYTGGETRHLFSWRNFAAFVAPSLFGLGSLRKLVDANITPELLRKVASEHKKGRQLLVATTNLDAEATVIWNMGALAERDDHESLLLFRRILLASSSVPGLFPPVLIAGKAPNGSVVSEMHVDGGVSTPFLAIPGGLLLETNPSGHLSGGEIYVLINGQLSPDYGVTQGNLPAILTRSFESMIKASLRANLTTNAAFAARNGMSLVVSEIPSGQTASSLDVSPATMQSLFELGRRRGASGEAWAPLAQEERLSETESVRPAVAPQPSARR